MSRAARDSPELQAAKIDATRLANEGLVAKESGDFATAATKLSAAFDALRVPLLALWLGEANLRLGKFVEALALFRQAQQLPLLVGNVKIQKQAQLDAAREEAALLPRVPRLHLESHQAPPGSVKVSIDGQAVEPARSGERLVNPGKHEITVRCSAGDERISLTLAEGETQTIRLDCPAPPAPQPRATQQLLAGPPRAFSSSSANSANASRTRQVVLWSALGVGATGILVGSVSGIVALSKRNTLNELGCDGQHCPSNVPASNVDTYNRWRHVSTGGFIAGALGAATGITVWLTTRKCQKPSSAALWADAQTVGLTGEF